MARISKYQEGGAAPVQRQESWRAGLYIRLSREDGDRAESESVSSQRALLERFLAEHGGISFFDYYIDDGWSGTDFDRPAFSRMIGDIANKKINCVIVKDLSRFGRNYVEAGKYLETVFPLYKVRFIAVNDFLDSVENPQSMNNVIVPFKNIINDEYCRDISVKVRSALDIRRRQGKFIGAFAAYGYKKDSQDHNRLVVDEEAAQTVRLIYARFLCGYSILAIARELNVNGVPNPSAYKRKGAGGSGLWADSTVRRILTSEVYIGNLVQKKSEVVSYKIHLAKAVERGKNIRVEGTHTAIISREEFERVQSLLTRDTRTPKGSGKLSVFSGFVKCADCGRAMQKRTVKQPYRTYDYYVCSTYKKLHSGMCTKHAVRADKLEEAVLTFLRKYISLAVDFDRLSAAAESALKDGREKRFCAVLAQRRRERETVQGLLLDLYPDYKSGILSGEQYFALKEKYEKKLLLLDAAIERTQAETETLGRTGERVRQAVEKLKSYEGVKELSRELMTELVENIYVYEGGRVEVVLACRDELTEAQLFLPALSERQPETALTD